MNYWQKRQAEQRVRYGDLTHREIRNKTAKLYKKKLKEVEHLLKDLYDDITVNGQPSMNELYRYNRLYKAREELIKALNDLGKSYLKILDPKMKQLYIQNSVMTQNALNRHGFDKKEAERVAKELFNSNHMDNWSEKVWCDDGVTSQQRIAKNMAKLRTTLEEELIDCVARGKPKDKMVEVLQQRFNVSFSEADRLARTEITYLQNQSTLDTYVEEGVKQYQYLAEIDNRTSDICRELNGNVYNVANTKVGINYPPMHPNCRSTTIPYHFSRANRMTSEEERRKARERVKELGRQKLRELNV